MKKKQTKTLQVYTRVDKEVDVSGGEIFCLSEIQEWK